FNDVFAFFISGPGIVGDPALDNQINIAVLPNSAETIVQIDSVNNNVNTNYYRSNQFGQSVQYDGLTSDFNGVKKSLTARADVTPCETYHLKLAVADRGDDVWDSGVFISDIRGGAPEAFVNFQGGIDYLVEDCVDVPDTLVISLFNDENAPVTYDLVVRGTATSGDDYVIEGLPDQITFELGANIFKFPIEVLSDLIIEGTETIIFDFVIDFGCGATVVSSLTVELRDQINVEVNQGVDTVIYCIGEGISLTAEGAGTFSWAPPEIVDDPAAQTVFATPTESTLVTVVGALGNCIDTTFVFLEEVDPMINIIGGDTVNVCNGDTIQLIAETNLPLGTISWTPDFGVIGATNNDTLTLSPFFSTEYQATVTLEGCSTTDSIFVSSQFLAEPFNVINDTTICEAYPIQLAEAPFFPGNTVYDWSPGEFFVDSTDAGSILNPVLPNQEYVLVSSTINGACTDTQRVVVDIIPSRINITNGDTLEVCAGYEPITLRAAVSPTGGSDVTWRPIGGTLTSLVGDTLVVQPGITVTYFASYEVNSCPQTDSILVKVDSLPNMDIELDPF
ncbi:MAG: choice-of-anchor L domain-containing protein, partial [Bacteroidota bacterium]